MGDVHQGIRTSEDAGLCCRCAGGQTDLVSEPSRGSADHSPNDAEASDSQKGWPLTEPAESVSPEPNFKARLSALVRDVVRKAQKDGSGLELGHRGVALYNPMRDQEILDLDSFPLATSAITVVPAFLTAAEPHESMRVVLQLVYDVVGLLDDPDALDDAFEATWNSFLTELVEPAWRYLSICYLENLSSDAETIDFGNGLAIHNRRSYSFKEDGWSDFQVEKLHEDWRGWSTFVLVVEERVRKNPDNLVLAGTGRSTPLIRRLLRALRLAKEGDIHIGSAPFIGRILSNRPAGSGFGSDGGATIQGQLARWLGSEYSLSAADRPSVTALYNQLIQLETITSRVNNLDLALDFFDSSYDRLPSEPRARLVDLVTALEALLGDLISLILPRCWFTSIE